jgi:hypothetical protein
MPLLTIAAHYAPSPSQALPDHIQQQDPSKYPPRSASRLNLHDDDTSSSSSDAALRHAVLEAHVSRSASHSRESSLEKLHSAAVLVGISESQVPSAAPPSSPRPNGSSSSSRQPLAGIIERVVDPKAAAYGHHRQTSIVHGIQHSRNGSLASSSSSPLSPQIIAAAGVGLLPESSNTHASPGRPDMDLTMGSRPPTALSGSAASPNIHPTLQRTLSTTESIGGTLTQRKLERMQSKSRRDHSQHASHSSRHHNEQKTVGEYALHVLFTHVRTSLDPNFGPSILLTRA